MVKAGVSRGVLPLMALLALPVEAQSEATMQLILERLARLEQDNVTLRRELSQLREQLGTLRAAPPPAPVEAAGAEPPLEERLEIQERRVAEQAETKVEASQRFPIRLTGMALFNTFYNTAAAAGQDVATAAAVAPGRASAGATFRQSVVGLDYRGPQSVLGAKVRGNLMFDFFDGAVQGANPPLRIRTGMVEFAWKQSRLAVGLEKPIFNPREPNSLLQVGISPLTGAGNLWRWQPQVRLEQTIPLARTTDFRAQIGMYQTSEDVGAPLALSAAIRRRRPGLQGRFELVHRLDDTRRLEFAPGFHVSQTLVANSGVPSRLVSFDWFANPWPRLEFSGFFFGGQNVHHFGALRQGFRVLADGRLIAVRARGGWSQFSFLATSRVTLNLMGGIHDDRNADLDASAIGANRTGAANLMFRIAPNVIVSLEALQTRTRYVGPGLRLLNRYDLAIAYLF